MLTNFTRNGGGGVIAVNGKAGVVSLDSAGVPMASDLTPLGVVGTDVDAVLADLAAKLGSGLASLSFDPLTGNLDAGLVSGLSLQANLDGRYQVVGTDLFSSTNGTIANIGADGQTLDLDVSMDAVSAILPAATAAEIAALAGTEEIMLDIGGVVKKIPLSTLQGGVPDTFASANGTVVNSGADGSNLDLDVSMDAVVAALPDATAAEIAALAGTEEVIIDIGGVAKMIPFNALQSPVDTFASANGTVVNSGADGSNLDLDVNFDAVVDATPDANIVEIGALADSDQIIVEIGGNARQLTLGDLKAYTGDVSVASAAFNSGDGVITLTKSDGTTVTVDIDGRFVRTVNAIAPDAVGNVPLSLTAVETGDLASRPAAPADATVYVVSNDADPTKDGQTFIYHAGNAQWYQVASFDVAANDARYVNVAGDTMAGQLILNADPTVALEAATKQYVDSKYDWIGFSPAP